MCVCVLYVFMCARVRLLCIPVNSLHQNENFLPGSVSSRLTVHDSVSQQLLQALHVYNTGRKDVLVSGQVLFPENNTRGFFNSWISVNILCLQPFELLGAFSQQSGCLVPGWAWITVSQDLWWQSVYMYLCVFILNNNNKKKLYSCGRSHVLTDLMNAQCCLTVLE